MPNIPGLKLGSEVDADSVSFDLIDIPLGPQLFQLLSLAFRDVGLEVQANTEINGLQSRIEESLKNSEIGYLLDVSIFTNEFGNYVLPYGQLLYPIGVGIEPIDAYAEFKRTKNLLPQGNKTFGLKNSSFFLWITRIENGFQVKTIPKEFRQMFVDKSLKEADRRELLGQWYQALPTEPYKNIIIANYWTEMEKERSSLIKDQSNRQQIISLSNQMRELQEKTNELFGRFYYLQAQIAEQQKYYNTLGTISTLSSIMRSAIDLKAVFSTKNQSEIVGSQLNPPVDVGTSLEVTQDVLVNYGGQEKEVRQKLIMNFLKLEDLESTLDMLYMQGGIPLPKREIFVPPILP